MKRFFLVLLLIFGMIPNGIYAFTIKNQSDIKVQVQIEYQTKDTHFKYHFLCYHQPYILPGNQINMHLADFCGANTVRRFRFTKVRVIADTRLIEQCRYKKGKKLTNQSVVLITGGHEDDIQCQIVLR